MGEVLTNGFPDRGSTPLVSSFASLVEHRINVRVYAFPNGVQVEVYATHRIWYFKHGFALDVEITCLVY